MKDQSFKSFAIKRLGVSIPLIFFVLILNFAIIQMAPGDPIYMYIGTGRVTPEYLDQMRNLYGVDRPLSEQLISYIFRTFQGDLGYSFWYKRSVTSLILGRMPATLLLMAGGMAYAIIFGILMGALSAQRYHSWIDTLFTGISLAGYSMPTFWLAQLLVLVFALLLGWFPSGGIVTIGASFNGLAYLIDLIWHLILPAFCLGSFFLALITRMTRGNVLEAFTKDYIKTARAKGLSEKRVLRHALKNSLLPLLTVISLNIAFLFSGAVVIETVFSWPGIGRLVFDALWARDYPILLGTFFITSILIIIVNLITDVLYGYFDPRVRLCK